METLRICREYEVSERHKNESNLQDFMREKQLTLGKIRNPKALEKLHAFRIWRENKYSKVDPTAGEFERIFKIEGELQMEARLAPTG